MMNRYRSLAGMGLTIALASAVQAEGPAYIYVDLGVNPNQGGEPNNLDGPIGTSIPFETAAWSIIPLPIALLVLVSAVIGITTSLACTIRFALPWNWAILVPLGLVAGLFVGQRSLWLAITRGGVHWKGDLHSLDSAQAGARVRL